MIRVFILKLYCHSDNSKHHNLMGNLLVIHLWNPYRDIVLQLLALMIRKCIISVLGDISFNREYGRASSKRLLKFTWSKAQQLDNGQGDNY